MRGIFPDIPGIPDIPDNVCSTPTSLPATMAMFDDALCYALQVLKKSHVSLKDEQRQSIWHAFQFMAETIDHRDYVTGIGNSSRDPNATRTKCFCR